jgi:hypothetical protein
MRRSRGHDRELLRLVSALCDGTLADEELARLDEILRDDPAARLFYVRYFDLHLEMSHRLSVPGEFAGRPGGEPLPAGVDPKAGAAGLTTARGGASGWAKGKGGLSSILNRWVLPLASVAALVFLAVWVIRVRPPVPRPTRPAPVVAELSRDVEGRWVGSRAGLRLGDSLRAGERLDLSAGLAEITFRSGARVVMQAPASLTLDAADRATLQLGRVVATVPESAVGFSIRTTAIRVVDLGTEFGVAVDRSGDAQVHVFKGEVELCRDANDALTRRVVHLAENSAVRVSANHGAITPIPARPDRFMHRAQLSPRTVQVELQAEGGVYQGDSWQTWDSRDGLTKRLVGCGDPRAALSTDGSGKLVWRNRPCRGPVDKDNLNGVFADGIRNRPGGIRLTLVGVLPGAYRMTLFNHDEWTVTPGDENPDGSGQRGRFDVYLDGAALTAAQDCTVSARSARQPARVTFDLTVTEAMARNGFSLELRKNGACPATEVWLNGFLLTSKAPNVHSS